MAPPPPMCFPWSASRRSTSSSLNSGTSYSDTASLNSSVNDGVSRGARTAVTRLTFHSDALVSEPPTVERKDTKQSKKDKEKAKARAKAAEKEIENESKHSSTKSPPRVNLFKFTRSKSTDDASYASPASVKKWSVQDDIDEEESDPVTTIPGLLNINSGERLTLLRAEMVKQKIDGYVIPSTDDHGSEYTALCDRRRHWVSGFTGSTGTAVVLLDSAHMFVDSRYWVQAERELDNNWILHRVGEPHVSNWDVWILEAFESGKKVGMDSRMITHEMAGQWSQKLKAVGLQLTFPYRNLVDVIWKDRPPRPRDPIFIHPTEYAGSSASNKLNQMRESMNEHARASSSPIAGTLVASLDAIAWLLNLRGNDIPFNPLFLAYLFVSRSATPKRTVLFTGLMKVNDELRGYLDGLGIEVREYNTIWDWLRRREWGEGKVIVNSKTPWALSCMITSVRYVVLPDWVENTRAVKNGTELSGIESAYERDGAAMVRWMAWLDEKIRKGHEVDEHEAGRRLTMFRKEASGFVGLAYENMSASGPNAAMPHYVPSRVTARVIDKITPYLMDSGGQYIDGTCDTTRTMHFGHPTEEQREAFTRVLQGHIAIDTAIFPEGTNGMQLDVLARRALWQDGMNYHHGTGHGFGAFLTVHEGPHSFASTEPLRAGMVITNEPGYYKEGDFGVRIESALQVIRVSPPKAEDGTNWLGFQRFTCVPIQMKMIKPSMLTKEESQWLKMHNSLCFRQVAPLIAEDKRAARWLKRECQRDLVPDAKVGVHIDW